MTASSSASQLKPANDSSSATIDRIAETLIITLRLNKEAQDYFTALRKKYFPAHINFLDAHLTLFHNLPSNQPMIARELQSVTTASGFDLKVTEPYHTGFGVAFSLRAAELIRLHAGLQETFRSYLIPQDRKIIHPHITIQNKVSPEDSKQLLQTLQTDFSPFLCRAIGIDTWLYLNGPWKHVEFFGFRNTSSTSSH